MVNLPLKGVVGIPLQGMGGLYKARLNRQLRVGTTVGFETTSTYIFDWYTATLRHAPPTAEDYIMATMRMMTLWWKRNAVSFTLGLCGWITHDCNTDPLYYPFFTEYRIHWTTHELRVLLCVCVILR